MSFENFPYSNFHELNLDWIVQKLKESYSSENPPDYPVKSVNGQTGDVIIAIPSNFVQSVNGETGDVVLYRNPLTQFPATDEVRWNLFRICDGTEKGIEFDENGASRIEGIRRIKIYDEDNPPDYPVTSVNGQTGDVQITAGVQSVNGKTGNVVTPFVNPNTDILTLDSNSPSILWGISRNVAGGNVALYITTGGTNPQAFIRYIPDGGQAINLPLLTNADIPESAGVVSVNGKTGVVTIYGTDILLSSSSSNTITDSINSMNMQISVLEEFTNDYIIEINDKTLWAPGTYYSSNGVEGESDSYCRLINYVPNNCIRITARNNMKLRLLAWDNNIYVGMLNTEGVFSTVFNASTPGAYEEAILNMAYYKENFPSYNFKVVVRKAPIQPITVDNTEDVYFTYSAIYNLNSEINTLQTKTTNIEQNIIDLQNVNTSQNQQISALQSADTTHEQQISALQSADTTHAQQIAELQTKIGTGIKEIKFTDVVSLPLRYPETGTDTDITENMACVNAILSRPGVQRTNLTIVFYNGYLTISGTIQGMSDITLYLTKT